MRSDGVGGSTGSEDKYERKYLLEAIQKVPLDF